MPVERWVRFQKGHDIGFRARKLFPGGKDASPSHVSRFNESITLTQHFISENISIIYEAAFVFNDVLAALDILVHDAEGWHGFEVKSSIAVSSTYINDAALQYYVITGAGLALNDFSIIHLKKNLKEISETDLAEDIFIKTDVTAQCIEQSEVIHAHIEKLKVILAEKRMPQREMGEHCHQPYTCDFIGFCSNHTDEVKTGLFAAIE